DLKDYAGDVAGAEKDFRKGLALSPSYGTGYLRFAEYLDKHGRIDEALVAIERARVLDPLTPRHHYYKGMLLNFTGSIQGAEALYLETLRVAPDFHPALIRLANIRRIHQGRFAEAVKLAEQAIAIDPRAQWIRPHLVNFYLELEEIAAARSYLAAQGNPEEPTPWLPICLYERELQRGVDLVRASRDAGAQGDLSDVEGYLIRDAALASGRLADAREELRKTPANANDFEAALDVFRMATLAQVSLALGDQREAETLARRVLNAESRRTPYATAHPKAVALAVLGEKDAAIEKLEQNFDRGLRRNWWYALEREPAFEAFRSDPRFRDLSRRAREHAAAQRRLLEQMRARGEVPVRAPGTTGKPPLC
ncbi:MAG: tetratricopeptide repeat protein, partial [Steroidobacteraceae bacterium]